MFRSQCPTYNMRAQVIVYDAHNNLRSHVVCRALRAKHFIRRPKNRVKRFLLFYLKRNYFERPFVGEKSYISPLIAWGIQRSPQSTLDLDLSQVDLNRFFGLVDFEKPFVVIVPGAAW